MATLPQCDAFSFIYDPDGAPAIGKLVTLKGVHDADGNPISLEQKTTTTDSEGRYSFNLPQNSTAYITARATNFSQCNGGNPFKVPAATSGELEPAFDPETGGSLVAPPLIYAAGVLSIPQASEFEDGYLSAEDFRLFSEGGMGVKSFNTRTGDITLNIADLNSAITAALILYRAPQLDMEAATKKYVDDSIAAALGGPPLDTTPPVISSVSSGTPGTTTATITWTTDEASDSQVDYGLTS